MWSADVFATVPNATKNKGSERSRNAKSGTMNSDLSNVTMVDSGERCAMVIINLAVSYFHECTTKI